MNDELLHNLDKFQEKHKTPEVEVRKAIAIDQVTLEPLPPQKKLTLWNEVGLLRSLWTVYSQAKAGMKNSWVTTLGGVLMALGPIVGPYLPPNYHWIEAALTSLGGIILGTAARDNGISSESAKPK